MMETFRGWEGDKRVQALYTGCEMALATWKEYTKNREISYIDSLVGLEHVVENDLPVDAMHAIKQHIDGNQPENVERIDQRYREPIVAMQDHDYYSTDEFDYMDLDFPQHVEYAYYSIYNLFRLLFDDVVKIEESTIINQFISSQLSYDEEITREKNEGQVIAAFQKWWGAVIGT